MDNYVTKLHTVYGEDVRKLAQQARGPTGLRLLLASAVVLEIFEAWFRVFRFAVGSFNEQMVLLVLKTPLVVGLFAISCSMIFARKLILANLCIRSCFTLWLASRGRVTLSALLWTHIDKIIDVSFSKARGIMSSEYVLAFLHHIEHQQLLLYTWNSVRVLVCSVCLRNNATNAGFLTPRVTYV